MKNTKYGSFVVVSDFHSYEWPLEKIEKYYLNEYETIYILGDVTDRGEQYDGTGGVDILRKIKKLADKYPGRIVYVPGNHDEFLYDYAKYKDNMAKYNIQLNHGEQTIVDIDKLELTKPKEFKELIDWLGNLPLQREHYCENKRFVLAHALFDETLFKENRYFSLEDYRNNGSHHGKYKNLLWFRKRKDSYNPSSLPRKDTTMIIGHTPLCYREGDNLNLKNSYGETVNIECVDGGIAYDGRMLKYSAGNGTSGIDKTIDGRHIVRKKVAIKKNNNNNKEQLEKNVNTIILTYINNSSTLEEAINKIMNVIYSIGDGYFNINGKTNQRVSKNEVKKYLEEIYMSYIPSNGNLTKQEVDYMEIFKLHFTKVALDYITKCQFRKFGSKSNVVGQMYELISKKDYLYITNSIGGARDIAKKVGIDNFIKWLNESNYKSFNDYINTVFGNQYGKKD